MNIKKVKELLDYDPIAGIATNRRTGKVNQRTLMIDGKKEYLNRVLYELVHGPTNGATVFFKDGNKNNFKADNLILNHNKPANTKRRKSKERVFNGVAEKWCTVCSTWKVLNEFRTRSDNGNKKGECIACEKERKIEYYSLERRQRERKCAEFKARYRIDHDEYDQLLIKQQGKCAICGTGDPSGNSGRFKYFSVDHCHTTGVVRGLLCNHCNRGIGMLQDSPDILLKAHDYLIKAA